MNWLPVSINPRFRDWLGKQDGLIQADAKVFWDETATHTDIAHGHRTGIYARMFRLVMWAATNHGYTLQ